MAVPEFATDGEETKTSFRTPGLTGGPQQAARALHIHLIEVCRAAGEGNLRGQVDDSVVAGYRPADGVVVRDGPGEVRGAVDTRRRGAGMW